MLQEMIDQDLQPDRGMYNAALLSCERGGLWPQALMLLQQMPVLPDAPCYACAVSACEKAQAWENSYSNRRTSYSILNMQYYVSTI